MKDKCIIRIFLLAFNVKMNRCVIIGQWIAVFMSIALLLWVNCHSYNGNYEKVSIFTFGKFLTLSLGSRSFTSFHRPPRTDFEAIDFSQERHALLQCGAKNWLHGIGRRLGRFGYREWLHQASLLLRQRRPQCLKAISSWKLAQHATGRINLELMLSMMLPACWLGAV